MLAETHGDWRIYHIDLATGAKLGKWVLSGATSMESLLWSLDGNTLYSAADRADSKDLVTIDLLDDRSDVGVVTFVSGDPSGFDDIEALAWIHIPEGTWRFGPAVGVGDVRDANLGLLRPTPNPFSVTTSLTYAVPGSSAQRVEVDVYDTSGRRVRSIVSGVQPSGVHTATWDGRDSGGARVLAGIYFYRVVVGAEKASRRVVYLR